MKRLHVEIPDDLSDKLDKVCKQREMTKAELIRSLLRAELYNIERYPELRGLMNKL